MTETLPIHRLEQYTAQTPTEVLVVNAVVAGDEDCVMIYRGFSSSLVRPTAFDPAVPVLPAEAVMTTIERLQGPYTPDTPQPLEPPIPWSVFEQRLTAMGL